MATDPNVELYEQLDHAQITERLADLGLDPATPAGRAGEWQLYRPYGSVDDWVDGPLQPGEHVGVAVPGVSGFGVPAPEQFAGTDADDFFESIQVASKRVIRGSELDEGVPVPRPTYRTGIKIFRVTGDDPVPAARSQALSNPQFGPGGADQVYVPDLLQHIQEGRLVPIDGESNLEVPTISLRDGSEAARIEDPRYAVIDPRLPSTAAAAARSGQAAGSVAGLVVGTAPRVTDPEKAR